MRFLQRAFAIVGLSLTLGFVAASASASPANPVAGTDYKLLDTAQATDSGKKIEVTEFFWYSCPHCFALEPELEKWVAKQGDKIDFKRVPISFDPRFLPQQKLYYTLEVMGQVPAMHKKVFDAIHVQHQRLDTDATILDFAVKQGLNKAKFTEVYNSFGVQSKAMRATQLQNAYKIDGVPMIAIDGRFLTAPSIVGTSMGNAPEPVLFAATLQVVDSLIAKATAEKNKTAAPPAQAKK
ncbi:thiol:disulfide interchange protein DsbA/DsbL [Glaciimonas sp. CA11.2]|uniref:thiol:disulfide interchange protein DsbA/DsbL n=1 Tax=unclassified Glaciimonas TaxID=2644401 RepID=UPI002AB4CEDE|nr:MULTISPECIES: thiol:disulfide interchange protein DsbA/DsbL [unclassified Glaciimonas]MDY7545992.1 thiol:disulfide interchange protein DsbA/DsbL [Glaciimonas sp. CA11.2]MEB0012164.1 thiol:disulfide interchange protein DsbA/DsbL [Glaciimonas sp. Cout2]MEB0082347.1 thiol:disulfide interchange protein DsbA/DsbL [Glaciimonas sp. Gout2]MEB0161305.1 thiol:disulfide interchange protein DsbA/DsbL [Glaciimonas sp. CA11.2]